MTDFVVFDITGADAQKFLQGQVTCDVTKLSDQFQATAISNLKGRVALGIWIRKIADDAYQIVISQDCADEFAKHIKKYAAFSKLTLSAPRDIFAVVDNGIPSFSESDNGSDTEVNRKAWQKASIATGNYWIVKATAGLWQSVVDVTCAHRESVLAHFAVKERRAVGNLLKNGRIEITEKAIRRI